MLVQFFARRREPRRIPAAPSNLAMSIFVTGDGGCLVEPGFIGILLM
jgi:hypothetical protein